MPPTRSSRRSTPAATWPAPWATSDISSSWRRPSPAALQRAGTCPMARRIGTAEFPSLFAFAEETTMPHPDKPSAAAIPGVPVPRPYPYADAPAFPLTIGTVPEGMPLHACMGLNSCQGSDRFGTSGPPGGQPTACAGQGYSTTAATPTSHEQTACRNQGGCGHNKTGEEMDNAGHNECKSLGSCATPINAERFSTKGHNRGKSVWARARKVFEEQAWPALRQELLEKQASGEVAADQPLPGTLGHPPAGFADTGPTYLWISNDNISRGNMTACGASGMSGAGGCS